MRIRYSEFSRTSVRVLFAIVLLFVLGRNTNAAAEESKPSQPASFQNPVLWEDLADIDVIRVGDTYYYSASNMHYSPGAPVLRSYDLVNWEYIGHSLPVLDFGPEYDLNGGNAYIKGSWASFFGYRKSNGTFYWGGCIGFAKTHIFTAAAAEGPWKKHAVIDNCYYDAGLLVDDDDTMYVAYGNTKLSVAQLSPDGTKEVKHQQVFESKELGMIEGSRFYKVNGNYYIFITRPANAEYVLRSTTGPFGPYTLHNFAVDVVSPIPNAGYPHQGGIVQTQKGDWYYMAFIDAYPGGRIPVLASMKWDSEGWPVLDAPNNAWLANYPYPLPLHPVKPRTGADSFRRMPLSPEWEWNHNPDNSKWSAKNGLTLQTATVTDDLYMARNTLTRRILGPESTATIALDYSAMKDGDRAGLAMLRDESAWIGVKREGGQYKVAMVNDITMKGKDWKTASKGAEVASAPVSGRKIWLRVSADIRPHFGQAAASTPGRTAKFFYSTDGKKFQPLGEPFTMNDRWQFFMGFRYAIFNYATQSLGGQVKIESFTVTTP